MKDFRLIQTMAYNEDCKEPDEKGYQDILNYPLSHGCSHHLDGFLSLISHQQGIVEAKILKPQAMDLSFKQFI